MYTMYTQPSTPTTRPSPPHRVTGPHVQREQAVRLQDLGEAGFRQGILEAGFRHY